MTISEIYKQYNIMPQLAQHQFRVAAVAAMICDNFSENINKQDIVAACLLHDMGNIIKFDLNQSASFLNENIDLEYWQTIQRDFKAKYGNNEHQAHIQIARELGVSDRVIELISSISFLGAKDNVLSSDFGRKIVHYSDNRVSPLGVISLEGRFQDLRQRYSHHGDNREAKDNFENSLRDIEIQIFQQCKIKPEDINDSSVQGYITSLREFEI